MNEPIIVVSAAIVNVAEKRLFMQRRSGEASSHIWHWVTPGGNRRRRGRARGSDGATRRGN